MDKRDSLFNAVSTFTNELFGDRDHFVCVYGSYASGHYRDGSDIDLFVALPHHEPDEFEQLRDFIRNLHIEYDLPLDDEVPYENKLIATYDDVRDAILLKAFTHHEGGYTIPKIVKDPEFLASRSVRLRLILNALTSPHLCISGNDELCTEFRADAEKAIILLAKGVARKPLLTRPQVLNALLRGEQGESGELYLGYKEERSGVIAYLEDLVARNHDEGI